MKSLSSLETLLVTVTVPDSCTLLTVEVPLKGPGEGIYLGMHSTGSIDDDNGIVRLKRFASMHYIVNDSFNHQS